MTRGAIFWEADDTPVVERVSLTVTLRNDQPMAIMEMFDISGESRAVEFPVSTAVEVMCEMGRFVRQVGYADPRACVVCGLPAVKVAHAPDGPSEYVHADGRHCSWRPGV